MLIKQGKTNWKYILIVMILAAIVGGGVLWCVMNQEFPIAQLPGVETSEEAEEEICGKDCANDNDCIVFGETGDCNCGCYNKNYKEWQSGGECFCLVPTSCKCVENKCKESLGNISFIDLLEGGNVKKITQETGKEVVNLERGEEDVIIYRIDDTIKLITPDYRDVMSSEKFLKEYIIFYENEVVEERIPTALDVYSFTYKNKEYFAVEWGSAGTGGFFSHFSIFIINREKKEVGFLGSIEVTENIEDVLGSIP